MTHDPERRRDIAHVSPVELYTPTLEASRNFFVDLMSLREVHREAGVVYLHASDDYQAYTDRLIEREHAGMGRTMLRAASPAAYERQRTELDVAGQVYPVERGLWSLGEVLCFQYPDGHSMGVYWDVDW